MDIPNVNLVLTLVRSKDGMAFEEFQAYCRAKSRTFPSTWRLREDGIHIVVPNLAVEDVYGEWEKASLCFRDDPTIALYYETFKQTQGRPVAGDRYYCLRAKHSFCDTDDDGDVTYNKFKNFLCEKCMYPQFDTYQQPLLIAPKYKKRLTRNRLGMLSCCNGYWVVAKHLYDTLASMLSDSVDRGKVASWDAPEEIIEQALWIRPRHAIGHELNACVKERCGLCGRPVEIRLKTEKRPILYGMTFNSAPKVVHTIALLENWTGWIDRKGMTSVHWELVVTGDVLDRLRAQKTKDLADDVIESLGELYGKNEYEYIAALVEKIEKIDLNLWDGRCAVKSFP